MADQCFLMISTLMMLTLVLSVIECGYGGYGHEYQHHDAHGHHGGHGSGYVQPHYHYYQVKNKKSGLVLGLGGLLTGLAAGLALGLIPVPMTMAMTATGKRSVQDTAQNPWEDVVHILKSQLTAKDESGICKIALKACTVDIAKIQQMFVESFRTSSRLDLTRSSDIHQKATKGDDGFPVDHYKLSKLCVYTLQQCISYHSQSSTEELPFTHNDVHTR